MGRTALEKRYLGLCDDTNSVMEAGGCTDDHKWTGAGLGDNTTRVDEFEAAVLRYMRENVAVVNMFLKQPYCELIIQDRDKTWIAFMSDIGGTLGLTLGASVVSLVEVVWYCL